MDKQAGIGRSGLIPALALLVLLSPSPEGRGASASLIQTMYKVRCSPSIDFMQVERFIVDPLLPRSHIETEIAMANRSTEIGIYDIDQNRTRRHSCRINPGEVVELLGSGNFFTLRYNGQPILVDFTFNPLLESDRPTLERVTFSSSQDDSLELCWINSGCEMLDLDAGSFPLTVD